jgi:hypothetical protein
MKGNERKIAALGSKLTKPVCGKTEHFVDAFPVCAYHAQWPHLAPNRTPSQQSASVSQKFRAN